MKYITIKDNKKRDLFLKFELKALYLKFLVLEFQNTHNNPIALLLFDKYSKLCTKINPIKIKNQCLITCRSKAVYRDLKISRLMVRENVKLGYCMGIRKSSW